MPALPEGATAPLFSLRDTRAREFSLAEHLQQGPVTLAVFKVSCPTCQFAFPYLEKLFRGMNGRADIVGISQDPANATELFTSTFDVTLPVLLDPPEWYPVSNLYDITHLPTIFLISPAGKILLSSVGWARQEIDQLNQALAVLLGIPPARVFEPGEHVPDFRSGCGAMN
jgi:peroxiredoxin